ncbi:MAG TPA: metal ABC transporter permease [Thermopetrobacter sp.]|nr:metal ABC transporter permease [Thermopetrobacter sp.]
MNGWPVDAFMLRALTAGLAVAAMAGPLGAFVVWRRIAYIGDALAHAALLGVALALLLDIAPPLGVLAVGVTIALAVHLLRPGHSLPEDSLIGIFAHAALAAGLVLLALWLRPQVDVMALLFGDILAVPPAAARLAPAVALAVLGVLALIWRRLLLATVNAELAAAEGMAPRRAQLAHALLLAVALAVALPLIGALLFTALLVIPPAAARPLARSPESMAALAAVIGMVSIAAGLAGAWIWDAPSGPAIVLAAFALFVLFHMAERIFRR